MIMALKFIINCAPYSRSIMQSLMVPAVSLLAVDWNVWGSNPNRRCPWTCYKL